VCDESVTTGRNFSVATRGAAPHDWLQLTGGSIGLGIPLATGAAIACPDRKVVNLQADGSGLYTAQALWTQARGEPRRPHPHLGQPLYAILKASSPTWGRIPAARPWTCSASRTRP
jgi:acetolactate synthase-1/2/3 large subunit